MFGPKTKDLNPQQVKAALDAHEILLIDVREPAEFAAERIQGAVNVPPSSFNPAALPDAAGKTVVLQCAGGKRSAMAVDQCGKANQAIDTHLAGGLMAWKAAGLPTVRG
ncbi:putative adenylyltransferase/sulfurtransferase MoeZ [mine drainage metagenome]|uniref:Putative adenylyltransferase/sulfurtransferase MoeZ n=1 Tax=mine drainage metagenome TaxID=410659 RepID=A0A1J5PBF8_9ZZZZ